MALVSVLPAGWAGSFYAVDHANRAKRSPVAYVLGTERARTWTVMSTSGRAQSVPKRSGTSRLLVARRGTKGQVKGYTNCLTSLLASTDNAEVGGSIPPSPTKSLVEGHFSSKLGAAESC